MPAPSVQQFKNLFTAQLIQQGFKKRLYDPSGKLQELPELPDKMKAFVDANSIALYQHWTLWQAQQTVTVSGVMPGPSTAFGAPGIALP